MILSFILRYQKVVIRTFAIVCLLIVAFLLYATAFTSWTNFVAAYVALLVFSLLLYFFLAAAKWHRAKIDAAREEEERQRDPD